MSQVGVHYMDMGALRRHMITWTAYSGPLCAVRSGLPLIEMRSSLNEDCNLQPVKLTGPNARQRRKYRGSRLQTNRSDLP